MSKPASRAAIAAALFVITGSAGAQSTAGDGFLFRPPPGSFTVRGGAALANANGGVFSLATSELTLDRGDFSSPNIGFDLALTLRPRLDLVFSGERSTVLKHSEYRDWVDNNDQPIEQKTRFQRLPLTASLRYYLKDRGRTVGSVAWIPAKFVPFVAVGGGSMKYRFEQMGDFVDDSTLAVFPARLSSSDWVPVLTASGGGEWSLGTRTVLTGELKYLHANGSGDSPSGDFQGYRVPLSGLATTVGITIRF